MLTARRVLPLVLCLTLLWAAPSCASSKVSSSKKSVNQTTAERTTTRPGKPGTTTTRRPTTTVRRATTAVPSTVVAIVASSQVAAARAKAPFEKFTEVRFVITGADGKDREYCALLADTEPLREQGLMGRSDLGGYDAMLFSWDADSTSAFWMRTVPIWLSIAWFDRSGVHVGQLDMEPCGDSDSCPRYGASAPYRWAMETLRGGLDRLGVQPGVVLQVGGACRSRPLR